MEFNSRSEKWMWRFIVTMIVGFLVYFPAVLLRDGSFTELLSQVNQQLSTDGLQIQLEIRDPLEGVLTVTTTLNASNELKAFDAQPNSLLEIEECFFFGEASLCESTETSLSVFKEGLYKKTHNFILPDEGVLSNGKYSLGLSLDTVQIAQWESVFEVPKWSRSYALRTPQGEDLDENVVLESSGVYVLLSRLDNLDFLVDAGKLSAQKMVTPGLRTEYELYQDEIPLHTWLLVLSEDSDGKELCINEALASECFSIQKSLKEESQVLIELDDASVEEKTYDSPSFSLINLDNDNIVLFVYFVKNDTFSESLSFELFSPDNLVVPFHPLIHDGKNAAFIKIKKNLEYDLQLQDALLRTQKKYLLSYSAGDLISTELKYSAELNEKELNSLVQPLNGLEIVWTGSSETFYEDDTRFIDLTGNQKFEVFLSLHSSSDKAVSALLEFPSQSLKINQEIAAYAKEDIVLKIDDLAYGDHEIRLDLEYENALKTAPSIFTFQYLPKDLSFDDQKKKFLIGLASILLTIFLLGCFIRRSKVQDPSHE